MTFEKATINDLKKIKEIYKLAQNHMINENNTTQWVNHEDVFAKDIINYINKQCFYIAKSEDEIVGFFAMIYGIDKTYNEIKEGKWLNENPYVTIHKIAVKYYGQKIAQNILEFIINDAINNNVYNIRIDTHKNNKSMKRFLEKNDFIKCGIISITNSFEDINSLREAYLNQIK